MPVVLIRRGLKIAPEVSKNALMSELPKSRSVRDLKRIKELKNKEIDENLLHFLANNLIRSPTYVYVELGHH